MRYLITGSGTLAQELVRQLGHQERIAIYSRSESRQHDMMTRFPEGGRDGLRYFIGDVRDYRRLCSAMHGIDVVIHTAALKRIECCEYNPQEAIATNIVGSQNVIGAAIETCVPKAMCISTDKAVESIGIYGSTKAVMEAYAIASNNLSVGTRTSVCRYANVRGSTGSVLQIWAKQAAAHEPLTITDPDMTRMWIDKEDAAKFILDRVEDMEGGEVFVPLCDKESLMSLMRQYHPNSEHKVIGMRSNEKLHEVLVSDVEARRCYDVGTHYVVYPFSHDWRETWEPKGELVPKAWRYSSDG